MLTLTLRRAGVALLTGSVAGAGLVAASTAPAHAADPVAPNAAATWLIGTLDDNHLLTYKNFGSLRTDVGLSIDAMLSLRTIGGHDDVVGQIADGVESHAAGYTAHDSYVDDWTDPANPAQIESDRSNALGKALAGLTTVGRSGAVVDDLETRLEAVTVDDGADAGRITDGTTRDGVPDHDADYANVFGQAFAVRGLYAVGSPEADAALTYLLGQQNDDGSFPEGMDKVGALDTADRNASVDATGTAVIQLAATQASDGLEADKTAAIAHAVAWLKASQAADGSFGGAGDFGANGNETGLAGQALRIGGEDAAAAKAAIWLRSRQVSGVACDGAVRTAVGAIAYNDAALAAGQSDGIVAETLGQWMRNTAQAMPAMLAAPAGGKLAVTAPVFARAGSTISVGSTGLAPGARGCLTVAGKDIPVTGTAAATATSVLLPAGTHAYVVTVAGPSATSASTALTALAAKKLPVHLRQSRVHRGARQVVKVTGLVRGESVRVRYGSRTVGRGVANASGAFRVSLKVGRSTGVKKLSVRGQFVTRHNTVKFRVVR